MTTEVQAVYSVVVKGHIDGPFKEWEEGIRKRVIREMQLQFGNDATVKKAFVVGQPEAVIPLKRSGNVADAHDEVIRDADGKPIKRGADVDCCPSCGVSSGWIGPPDSSHCPDKWHRGM